MRTLRTSLFAAAIALSAAGFATTTTNDAHASVSIAVTWERLLGDATSAAIVTPEDQRAVWENGRIYTYTRVHVDRVVAGDGSVKGDGETWVRTMGGIVGKIGQSVDGEAVLTVGRPCLLFLHAGPAGTFEVTARAQGQFPVVADPVKKGALRIIKSGALGMLVKPTTQPAQVPLVSPRLVMAADKLHDRPIDDATKDIAVDWPRLHAK
jgi:hypothetical protein